ncbi:restriction endonuclease subunit S domain-containing protein [Tunturiibacter lichenicola]|uniref:restriction endonuclease subunit S n=1 Tax=Tunturiibacter lichenicola TaxID=2051959 RepID=UPI0021B257C1|nr:restriction endonuclease subunit S [Edaphobacter lichenicola]
MRVIDPQLLPAGWQVATLEEILDPTDNVDPKNHFEKCFDYIDIEAVDNSVQRISSPKRLEASAAPSRARRKVQRGDIVFSLVRPYLKNIAIVGGELDGAIASTAFFVCRPNSSIDERFLFNYLRQDSFIEGITTYGDSPPAGHDDEFVRLQIPIAPAREQERIADALDELLSDLDAGVEALRRAQAKLALYRASVLKAAVQGDLTAEWRKLHPDAEPAPVLLQRILAERRQRWEQEQLRKFKAAGKTPPANWKAKYKEPVAPDTTNLPPLPKGWCWATLTMLSTTETRNGISVEGSNNPLDIPALGLEAIATPVVDLRAKRFLPIPLEIAKKYAIRRGDLFIMRGNGSRRLVGKCSVAPEPDGVIVFPDTMIRSRAQEAN